MNIVYKFIYDFLTWKRRKAFRNCGKDVSISKGHFSGNIEIGEHVKINSGAWFVASKAKIVIHDHVLFGPNVTIYTGGHVTNILGKHICEITNKDKEQSLDADKWDKDVVIESGCWIGTRVIILKGVTIGRGSVIGAGAVVTKNVPPYSVYVGVPVCKIFPRFNEDEIREHEELLKKRGMTPDAFFDAML